MKASGHPAFAWAFVLACALACAALVNGPTHAQAPASVGATWKINGNGYLGDLVITQAVDGRLTGSVYGQDIEGFYAAGEGSIAFVRYLSPGKPFQLFIGTASAQGLRGDFYPITAEGGASADRLRFDWSATLAPAFIGPVPGPRVMTGTTTLLAPPTPTPSPGTSPAPSPAPTEAMPAPPPPPTKTAAANFSGHTFVEAPAVDNIAAFTEGAVVIRCPADKVASGYSSARGLVPWDGANLIEAAPLADGSGFRFALYNGSLAAQTLNSLGIVCIDRPDGYQIVESTWQLQSRKRALIEASCPVGQLLIGGGSRASRAVYTAASAPRADGGAWQAHFRSDLFLPGSDAVHVFAVCVADRYGAALGLVASPESSLARGAMVDETHLSCGGGRKGLSAGVYSSATPIKAWGPMYILNPTRPPDQAHSWKFFAITNVDADRADVGMRAICASFQ